MSKILEKKLENVKIEYFLSNDVAFKTFFRKNTGMLKKVISMSTKIKESEIKKMTILNSELIKDTLDDKLGILDLLVEINDEKQINIEMQNVDKNNMPERLEYYLSKKYVENIQKGEDYAKLKHVYGIYFLNYDDKNYPNFYSIIENYDTINKELIKTVKTPIIYNLSKINEIDNYHFTEEEKDILRFIKTKKESELKSMAKKRISLDEAMRQLQEINADDELKTLLFYAEKKRLDELSDQKYKERIIKEQKAAIKERNKAFQKRDEAFQKRDEAFQKRDEAIKLVQNMKEAQLKNVINMLNDNLDINIISKYTNLTVDEILKIKKSNT
ncbi:MAG: Rpn family recombination-promoting nuclease/putative transposase [Bacilli bacterium]|nr:Rpn family recombination-promoting nuclease/putative transposase [Bacilli bacterium]